MLILTLAIEPLCTQLSGGTVVTGILCDWRRDQHPSGLMPRCSHGLHTNRVSVPLYHSWRLHSVLCSELGNRCSQHTLCCRHAFTGKGVFCCVVRIIWKLAHDAETSATPSMPMLPLTQGRTFKAGPHVQCTGRTSNAGLYAQRRAFRSLQGRTFNAGHTILIIAPMIGNAYYFRKCAVFSKDCLHATIGKFSGVPKSEMMTILLEARRPDADVHSKDRFCSRKLTSSTSSVASSVSSCTWATCCRATRCPSSATTDHSSVLPWCSGWFLCHSFVAH